MKKRIILLTLLLLLLSIPIYAFFIEPKRIVIHTHKLGEENGQQPLKIVQLSDIHIQENYSIEQLEKIVTKTNALKPDIVTFTGDLFDNYAEYGPTEQVAQTLNKLSAPLGKFAIFGNHDYGGGAVRIYPDILAAAGFQLLQNSGTTVSLQNGQSIYIGGLDDALLGSPSIPDALANKNSNDYTILLSHEPDAVDLFSTEDIQLILSGHSHGGQVKIPFFPIKNIMAEKYFAGFYKLSEKTTLFVNTGLGTTAIPVRLGVPPEITLFNVYL
ncbi:metallophosphoesterase [Enterococcus rivorum]|uniref:Phosphatase n=1 Tax=Enterococcus rivorum TaxID=762845 RepID=A0A1E5KVH2_9ENTE|nr:metallophosphoesterase [Enterococcus rivorum]MBP2098326.1 putative MPP superfamily phosphohydrolase [Enterococcus rivorum]OEH81883.1 phosphatase [Enterococcus rivorum]